MLHRHGFTLMEMIVVLVIVAICAVIAFPNFTAPTEQAKALTAKNNLLAIYSAQRNYYNNNGLYCLSAAPNPTCADTLADINSSFALNIQDDGSYTYACATDASGFLCTATRTGIAGFTITVTNSPVQLKTNINPSCSASLPASYSWCP